MRVAVSSGPVPDDPRLLDMRTAAGIAELGFTGVGVFFGYDESRPPHELDPGALDRSAIASARAALAAHGLTVVTAWSYAPTLIAADEHERRREVARLCAAVDLAAEIGARFVTSGAGSLNPLGGYWPHPGNHGQAAQARLVQSLSEAAPHAQGRGVIIALESHVTTTLDTPERTRAIVDAVGSPAVRVNLDPVNFVADLPTLWDSAALVDRVFDCLAEVAVAGHVKDVYPENRLVLHLSETVIGDGVFAIERYLERFEAELPDAFLVVEHLPADLVAQAKRELDRLTAGLGIRYR